MIKSVKGSGLQLTREQLDLHRQAVAAEGACAIMLENKGGDLKPHVDKLVVIAADGKSAPETKVRALNTLIEVVNAARLETSEHTWFEGELAQAFSNGAPQDVAVAFGKYENAIARRRERENAAHEFSRHRAR